MKPKGRYGVRREGTEEVFWCRYCGDIERRPAGVMRPKAMIARLLRFEGRHECPKVKS